MYGPFYSNSYEPCKNFANYFNLVALDISKVSLISYIAKHNGIDYSILLVLLSSLNRMKYLKAGKSRKTCLTNHTRSISHHIMPLVINGLGGGHTDRHTQTDTHTRIPTRGPKQFQETRRARPKAARAWFNKVYNTGYSQVVIHTITNPA